MLKAILEFFKGKSVELSNEEMVDLASILEKEKKEPDIQLAPAVKNSTSNNRTKEAESQIENYQRKIKELENEIQGKNSEISEMSNKLDAFLIEQQKSKEEEAQRRKLLEEEQERKRLEDAENKSREYIEKNGVQKNKIAPKDEKMINSLIEIGKIDFNRMQILIDGMHGANSEDKAETTKTTTNKTAELNPATTDINDYVNSFTVN